MDELLWLVNELETGEPMSARETKMAGAYLRMAVQSFRKRLVHEVDDAIVSMIRKDLFIPAIKLRRRLADEDLRTAKEYVEGIRDRMRAAGEVI